MEKGLQVHVIPVGWEFDRAVMPFLMKASDPRRRHAHRAYLVVPGVKGGKEFPGRIENALKEAGIEVRLREVERERGGKSIEFESTVAEVARICHDEAFRNENHVHVNISSGSKIGAFASGLGAMAYQKTGRVHIYYVQPESYTENIKDGDKRVRTFDQKGLSSGLKNVLDVQLIPVVQYSRAQMQLIAFLRRRGGAASLGDVLEHLIEYEEGELREFTDLLPTAKAKEIGVRQTPVAKQLGPRGAPMGKLRELRNAALGRLRTMTRRLHDEGWVKTDRARREHSLRLTPPGHLYALLAQDEGPKDEQK